MDWIELESLRLFCPDFADELVWCEALEGLEPSSEVVSADKVGEMGLEGLAGALPGALERQRLGEELARVERSLGAREGTIQRFALIAGALGALRDVENPPARDAIADTLVEIEEFATVWPNRNRRRT